VQVSGHEACADALEQVRARLAATDDGRLCGLDRERPEVRKALLEPLADARDVAAGADARDQEVDAVGEVAQDLRGGRAAVDLRVGRVLELLWHPRAVDLGGELVGARDRPLHPVHARRQFEFGAVGGHQAAAFDRHRLGHHENQPVAAHRGDHRKPDTSVAGRRLDDRAAPAEHAATLSVFEHRQPDSVFDRAARIGALRLHPHLDLRAVGEEAVDPDVRRITDCLEDVRGFHGASLD
jgi:hypothetical protein